MRRHALFAALVLASGCRAIAGVEDLQLTNPPCNGVATDLDNDPKNCGACNHDCLGGACSGGMCQPDLLMPLENGETVLNLSKPNAELFTLTDYEVIACLPDRCQGTVAYPVSLPQSRFMDYTFVVDPQTSDIYYASVNGSGGQGKFSVRSNGPPRDIVTNLISPGQLSLADGHLFYVDYGGQTADNGLIGMCNAPDCSTTTTLQDPSAHPFGAYLVGSDVYFIAVDETQGGPVELFKCALADNCATPTAISPPGALQGFFGSLAQVSDGFVLNSLAALIHVGLDGSVKEIVQHAKSPDYLSSDGKSVVAWCDKDSLTVYTLDTSNPDATPTLIVVETDTPVATAIDDTTVYYGTGSRVERVAR